MSRLHGLGQQKPDPALSKAPGSRAKGSLLPGAQGGPFALLSLCAEFSRHPGSVSCPGGDASRWTGVVLF